MKANYSDPANYQWAIELKEIGEPIGSIAAVEMNENTEAATIGYCIGRKWWGQGIMAEALCAVISFLKVLRVETDRLLIREAKLTPDLLEILIRMSEDWEKEGSCYDYRKNDRSDIEGNRIFTAEIRNEVVGIVKAKNSRRNHLWRQKIFYDSFVRRII